MKMKNKENLQYQEPFGKLTRFAGFGGGGGDAD